MDNYKLLQEKKALAKADLVLSCKRGNYLDGSLAFSRSNSYVDFSSETYRLLKYRAGNDDAHTEAMLIDAISKWIKGSTAEDNYAAAFTIKKGHNGESNILYSSSSPKNRPYTYFSSIPECMFQKDISPKQQSYAIHGLLTGNMMSRGFSDLFSDSMLRDAYCSCILIPCTDAEIQKRIDANRREISELDQFKSRKIMFGSHHEDNIPVIKIQQAITTLKQETEYLEQNEAMGFVRCAVRFGASDAANYSLIISLLHSCMTDMAVENQAAAPPVFERSRIFRLPGNSVTDCLSVPAVKITTPVKGCVLPFTIQDIPGAVSFCLPPRKRSKPGLIISNYNVDENSADCFPVVAIPEKRGIKIGTCEGGSAKIPFDALTSHVFITGSTGTGKSTTVKKLLFEINEARIPFLVFEAAKQEYWRLLSAIPNLKVYGSGQDCVKLLFNPLQPEQGVLIENHVSAVVRALVAATDGEHPIPEALHGLLKMGYSRFGWEFGMTAYDDPSKPYPTFADILKCIPDYIREHAQYGPEVQKNLTAALTIRIESFSAGALAGITNVRSGLTARDLLGNSTVVELASFSPEASCFLMNILLFKVQSYLANIPESTQLKRIIVLEEAHNVFRKIETIMDQGRALSNEYFDKALSEIRASGTGIILVDQRPSIMSEAVIANTAVKIIHALTAAEDLKIIGESCHLSEFQTKKLSELDHGEAVIWLRGLHGLQHTRIYACREKTLKNTACLFCTARFRCWYDETMKLMLGLDDRKISLRIGLIEDHLYHLSSLRENMNLFWKAVGMTDASRIEKMCFLGLALDRYGSISLRQKRMILASCNYFGEKEAIQLE